jgi:RNA-directed DNA polymerase
VVIVLTAANQSPSATSTCQPWAELAEHHRPSTWGWRSTIAGRASPPDPNLELEVIYCVGGVASPLLANVYLHYVFDLWAERWRRRNAWGDVILVRYADDFIAGFVHKEDAERFLADLAERFAKFGLELRAEKTRLIEFGRFAAQKREVRGLGKPETFDFLGFTHICGKTRAGNFQVLRITVSKRSRNKLRELKEELKRRRHLRIPEQGNGCGASC